MIFTTRNIYLVTGSHDPATVDVQAIRVWLSQRDVPVTAQGPRELWVTIGGVRPNFYWETSRPSIPEAVPALLWRCVGGLGDDRIPI